MDPTKRAPGIGGNRGLKRLKELCIFSAAFASAIYLGTAIGAAFAVVLLEVIR